MPQASKYSWFAMLAVALALLGCGESPSEDDLLRASANGPVLLTASKGVRYEGGLSSDGKVSHFLGIPFAEPPVDQLRWRAPQPVSVAPGSYPATSFAAACMQSMHMIRWYRELVESFGGDPDSFPVPNFDEDCLYLNIWRPEPVSEPLPVLVYFHGGSNRGGWAFEPNYIGENLARQGLIVVSIPYRLGVFGFLAHPALEESNFALRDAIAGLQWLADNIASAGGDPQRITIMGESAGAGMVQHLMAAPQARGLFQGAISQSYGLASPGERMPQQVTGVSLSAALKRSSDDEGIESMRQLPALIIADVAETVYTDLGYEVVSDPDTLPDTLESLIASGEWTPVPLLAGTNLNESRMYLSGRQSPGQWLDQRFGPGDEPDGNRGALLAQLLTEGDTLAQLDRLATAVDYDCPTLLLAGLTRQGGASVWVYHFTRQRPGEMAARMGAYHGAELPYVFNTHDDWLPTDPEDRVLGETMMRYWVNFARSGNPNGPGLPEWPAFEAGTQIVQVLDRDISPEPHRSLALCALLN